MKKVVTNNGITVSVLGVATALLAIVGGFSLQWRMEHDSPIMLYIAFLIDHFRYVPYRDIFDMNMPGVYYANLFLGRYLFGYSDLGFRIADLLYLGTTLGITWFWMRRLGWVVAWCGAVLFGFWYLGEGPIISMQREYLLILPIVTAVLVSTSLPRMPSVAKGLAVGLLFGAAATIKPHSAIAFPVVLAFQALDIRERAGRLTSEVVLTLLAAIGGFALPALALLVHLWRIDALPSFLDIARNYWPLYTGIAGTQEVIVGKDRVAYFLRNYFKFGGQAWWLVPAALGVWAALFRARLAPARKRRVKLLGALAVCYGIYPLFAGKFWTYHWTLFAYFVIQLASLCLLGQPGARTRIKRLIPVLALVLVVSLTVRLPREITQQVGGRALSAPKRGRVDRIAAFLEANMRPGDKVQPLDWTGGAVHAMLMTEAEIATPFVYDFHFYHHLSNPYIQKLRARFVEDLKASDPRFIIQILGRKPWVSGVDTSREFAELQDVLNTRYGRVQVGDGYVIYMRRP